MPYFVKIGRNVAKIRQFNRF